ncbi:MAG TPA: hypothetical protein VM487_13855 [Phycisphaerae bacterium]|nr:hypothetical protein [Phycisphaerae bacterium]
MRFLLIFLAVAIVLVVLHIEDGVRQWRRRRDPERWAAKLKQQGRRLHSGGGRRG